MRDTSGLRSTGAGYVIVSSSLSSTPPPPPPRRVVELQRRRRHSRPHSAKDLSNRLKQFLFFCIKGESIDKLSNQFDF